MFVSCVCVFVCVWWGVVVLTSASPPQLTTSTLLQAAESGWPDEAYMAAEPAPNSLAALMRLTQRPLSGDRRGELLDVGGVKRARGRGRTLSLGALA